MEKDNEIFPHPTGVGGEHKIVETFAGDMAEILENDREGLVKKIIHKEKEYEEKKKNFSPESKENKLFMFVSFLFLFFALLILFFFFVKKENNVVQVEKRFTPIIFNDRNTFLEVSELKKEEIAQTVLGEINTTKVKVGGVEGIYLTENKQIIGFRRFLTLIKSNFVSNISLSDNTLFFNDNFLLGGVILESKNFFILLKVRSFADVFDALHSWEEKMFFDLNGFFGLNLSADTNYLLTKEFQDGIVENKNARILYDKDNKAVLMYVFGDDNSVVISNSQNAVHEIMLRLASAQKKQ
ncbi:MAG: hypothetical protein WC694_02730 [Candidatus Paceibacterota bacterium]|jgi:hypothetical protein